VRGEKLRPDGCEQRLAGAGCGAHPQRAAQRRTEVAHLGIRALELGEQRLAALEVVAPRRAQRHPTRRALQQAHPEAALEGRDRAADRGHVAVELPRGLRRTWHCWVA
jgi:hypothetical protein